MTTHSSHEPSTDAERCTDVRAQLDELLEQGEISREAFAEYAATADHRRLTDVNPRIGGQS